MEHPYTLDAASSWERIVYLGGVFVDDIFKAYRLLRGKSGLCKSECNTLSPVVEVAEWLVK